MTIDWWTLGFQTVNVAILVWLLGHFFWKPVAAMIEARRASTQKLADDAEKSRVTAAAALADIEETRAGFAAERESILAEADISADAARTALLAKAQTRVEVLQATAEAAIAKNEEAQNDAWADRSSDLAIEIAGRLAGRLDAAAVQASFLEWLVDEIRKLPETTLQAAGRKDLKLELASAVKLDAATRTTYLKSITEAFGSTPNITFRTEPNLIAGFELTGEHLIVSSSWQADLKAIRAALTRNHPE